MTAGKRSGQSADVGKDNEAFLAWLDGVPDPRDRFRRATEELERHQQAVEKLSALRALAVADAYESGDSVRALAEQLGVSPSRVHQLIQEAKPRPVKEPGRERRQSGRQKGNT